MHQSALASAKQFFDVYLAEREPMKIVEIGSQDVNGSLRSVAPRQHEYIGVDYVAGNGVDMVLTDPYVLPFETNSINCIVTSSCFEHSEFFWLVFLEMARVVADGGLIYINAPSNGAFHRWPVDCYRFYPDSGNALARWAARNEMDVLLVESFVGNQAPDDGLAFWNDFVAVFLKGSRHLQTLGTNRMLKTRTDFSNGICTTPTGDQEGFLNYREFPQDMEKLQAIGQITAGLLKTR